MSHTSSTGSAHTAQYWGTEWPFTAYSWIIVWIPLLWETLTVPFYECNICYTVYIVNNPICKNLYGMVLTYHWLAFSYIIQRGNRGQGFGHWCLLPTNYFNFRLTWMLFIESQNFFQFVIIAKVCFMPDKMMNMLTIVLWLSTVAAFSH